MAIKEFEVTSMELYKNYLLEGTQPEDKKEAKRIRQRAFNYTIVNDKLYRKSFMGPLLRCLIPSKATKLTEEIHEGVCGNHSRGKKLVLEICSKV